MRLGKFNSLISFAGFTTGAGTSDAQFGPNNILYCRSGKKAQFPLNKKMSDRGLIISLYFKPYSSGSASNQTIFSIRDATTITLLFGSYYHKETKKINFWIYRSSNFETILTSDTSVGEGNFAPGSETYCIVYLC